MNKTERLGGTYYPYVPDMLCEFELSLNPTCANAVAQAQQALSDLNTQGSLTDTEPLARLLLRAEAVSSSRIEGLEMPASKLMEYEELDRLGVDHRIDATEAQVLGNLHAMISEVDRIASKDSLSLQDIQHLHASLLRGTRYEKLGGVIRTEQNWIGGNRVNPVGAAYVPPEPAEVPLLLEDLVRFINESQLPPIATAAVAHAQFETIHPFADGNGRTGRALIHVILRWAGLSRTTIPPVSPLLATDKDRYVANLSAYRTDDDGDREYAMNEWVEYFANVLTLSCHRAAEFEQEIQRIRSSWNDIAHFRKGSAGYDLMNLLPGTPVISIKTAQSLTGKSYPAARSAVLALQEAGILRQNAKNRKSGIYVADDILQAFNLYERALATSSGDTAVEKPQRPVPQRRR